MLILFEYFILEFENAIDPTDIFMMLLLFLVIISKILNVALFNLFFILHFVTFYISCLINQRPNALTHTDIQ